MLSNGRSRRSNNKVKNIKGVRFLHINAKTQTNAHKKRTSYLSRKSGGKNKTLKRKTKKRKTKKRKTQKKTPKSAKQKLSAQTIPIPDNFSDYGRDSSNDGYNRMDSPNNEFDLVNSSNDGYNRMDSPIFELANSSNDGYNRMDSPNNEFDIVNSGGKNNKHKRKKR
jgi:hypothetical protein